jgi:sterol desaturase/sphingolipid hydroxylase (fatty acid hydroxylase superfamily)
MRSVIITIPALIALALVEYAFTRWRSRPSHDLVDSAGNIGCGLLEQGAGLVLYPLIFAMYTVVEHQAVFQLPTDEAWGWAIGFILSDLAFYVFHRAAHSINVIWATHIVHHQSTHFNYTVAMRNAAFQRVFAVWFYLPLAVIGVPGEMLLPLLALSVLYQFSLHTRFFGSLGPFGWLFNTPSHHRVHHAEDPEYVGHNYSAILIVWDRLFGTFCAERYEPSYGAGSESSRTSNPLWANVQHWVVLFTLCRGRSGTRLRRLLGRPGETNAT